MQTISSILLKQYNINKKLISCHLFNEDKIKEKVVSELLNNRKIALVSDQGSPIISDPGYIVSKYIIDYKERGYPPVSHSEVYRENYAPSYRVMQKKYADKMISEE